MVVDEPDYKIWVAGSATSQGQSGKDNHVIKDIYGYLLDINTKQGVQLFKVVWSLTKKGKNSGR